MAISRDAITLLCTVRGCPEALVREGRRLACPRGHAYDVARSGYVNLLQPQDRRSSAAGDSRETREARRRLVARGVETPLVEAFMALLPITASHAALDVGCGEGDHLAALVASSGCAGHGLDISTAAIDAAARRYQHLHWVIANADRLLPYADGSFHSITSITARRNAAEFRRVLHDDGMILVVVPGPDDLRELRAAVLGEGVARDRVENTVASLAPLFTLARHERIREVALLEPEALRDIMTASYRGLRASQREVLAALGPLEVTLSRDALLFRPAAAVRAAGTNTRPTH